MLQLNAQALAAPNAAAAAPKSDASATNKDNKTQDGNDSPFKELLARSRASSTENKASTDTTDDIRRGKTAKDDRDDEHTALLPDACLAALAAADAQRAHPALAPQAAAQAANADRTGAEQPGERAGLDDVLGRGKNKPGEDRIGDTPATVRDADARDTKPAARADSAAASGKSAFEAIVAAQGKDASSRTREDGTAAINAASLQALAQTHSTHGNAPAQAAAPVVATVPAPVNSPAFAPSLASTVTMLANEKVQSAELILKPAELGPINVQLSLSGADASIAFAAAQPETRQAIEAALPTLKTMLAEHGVALTQGSVSDQTAQQQRGFGDRSNQRDGSRSNGSSRSTVGGIDGASSSTTAGPTVRKVINGAGVDLYA